MNLNNNLCIFFKLLLYIVSSNGKNNSNKISSGTYIINVLFINYNYIGYIKKTSRIKINS